MAKSKVCERWCLIGLLSTCPFITLIYLVIELTSGSFTNQFVKLQSGCPIISVYHRAATRTYAKVDSCRDQYIYEFAWCQDGQLCSPSTAPATVGDTSPLANRTLDARLKAAWPDAESGWTDGYTEVKGFGNWTASPGSYSGWQTPLFLSEVETKTRTQGTSCEQSTDPIVPGKYGVAQWATCYAPKDVASLSRVTPLYTDGNYECGAENTPCIKLNDPSLEVSARLYGVYISLGILAFFLSIWLCFLKAHGWSCKRVCFGDGGAGGGAKPDVQA